MHATSSEPWEYPIQNQYQPNQLRAPNQCWKQKLKPLSQTSRRFALLEINLLCFYFFVKPPKQLLQ